MLESDRLISSQSIVSEEAIDRAIRPLSLSEYVGQDSVSSQMQIFINAAKKRNDPLDHVLIFTTWTWQNYFSEYHSSRNGS